MRPRQRRQLDFIKHKRVSLLELLVFMGLLAAPRWLARADTATWGHSFQSFLASCRAALGGSSSEGLNTCATLILHSLLILHVSLRPTRPCRLRQELPPPSSPSEAMTLATLHNSNVC